MRNTLERALLVLIALIACTLTSQAAVEHLLPTPQQITVVKAPGFKLNRAVAVVDNWSHSELLRDILTDELGCRIVPNAKAQVVVKQVERIEGSDEPRLEAFEPEAYRLTINKDVITIEAVSRTGVIRAAQTLQQLAETDGGRVKSLESVAVTDWPAFKVRGFMHDVGRSFITIDELERQIRLYSRFKINVFQWHMTENQAWRFEVKSHPELTAAASMTRFAGLYYTQEQCRQLDALAHKYGVTIIPELDMPGHSAAFGRATGVDMQTDEGIAILKDALRECCEVFPHSPYIHIGGDEVRIKYDGFLNIMSDYVHAQGRRVIWWNRCATGLIRPDTDHCDMGQCWATAGTAVKGLPCIDCRYNYTNHFDVFADLVGMYRSNIFYKQHGDDETAGFISCPWNDRNLPKQEDIITQNNVFAVTIASGERAWRGGGKEYIEKCGAVLPNEGEEYEEFADWERRFLFHKAHSLKDEPIPYVAQTQIRWRISEPVGNGGDFSARFPWDDMKATDIDIPEAVNYNGKNYGWTLATGGGIYLNHTWGTMIPGIWGLNQAKGQTAYAYTYVYSPKDQTVGAQIEFQNYGRSERDAAPANGNWDRKGSDVWLNGVRIEPPLWDNNDSADGEWETLLLNENFPARKPLPVHLHKGWNKVFLKLPYVDTPRVRLNKWLFTFVLTDLEGREAVKGLVYSPDKEK